MTATPEELAEARKAGIAHGEKCKATDVAKKLIAAGIEPQIVWQATGLGEMKMKKICKQLFLSEEEIAEALPKGGTKQTIRSYAPKNSPIGVEAILQQHITKTK